MNADSCGVSLENLQQKQIAKTVAVMRVVAEMADGSKFRKGSGVYVCELCGKKTRETGNSESDIGLCAHCQEVCGWENHILDGGSYSEVPEDMVEEVKKLTEVQDDRTQM